MGNCASTGGEAPLTNTPEQKPQTKHNTEDQSTSPEAKQQPSEATNATDCETKEQNATVTKSDNADPVSRSASRVHPVNLDASAPVPTTASPHALPRGDNEEQFNADETKKQLHPFRNGVSKVLYQRRIWSRLASELDAAEETDLLNKVDFHRSFESGRTEGTTPDPEEGLKSDISGVKPSYTPTARTKAINTPRLSNKERLSKRRVYQKQVTEHSISDKDVYPEMEHAADDFLWALTYSQHKARKATAEQPTAKGKVMKNGRQFDVASLSPLSDDCTITDEWIHQMMQEFRKGKILSHSDAFHILRKSATTLLPEKNCVDLKIPRDAVCTVVGDLHGQLDDLLMIFREAGEPTAKHHILFNGDFVDRGAYSSEIIWILLAYRILYPNYIHLNRGNHECSDMNAFDGFQKEMELKYSIDLYWFSNHVFAALPIAHLVQVGQQRIFVVHAGLSFDDFTLEEMNAENRFLTSFPMNSILQDLIWSDPFDGVGRQLSRRGAGCQFGIDVVQRFLVKNNVHLIIRSHECEDNGFSLWFENRLYTIFSASNYCGDSGNYGAFCVLSNSPSPQIRVYSAKQQVAKYSDRQVQIRQSLLAKLLVRIASRIFELERVMEEIAESRGTPNLIPPYAWSYALFSVLGLDCAFLPLATKLGCNVDFDGKLLSADRISTNHAQQTYITPYTDDDRATRQLTFIKTEGEVASMCDRRVMIDIKAWVTKFKPQELAQDDLQGRIAALLYDTTSPFLSGLESLFQHFDQNGDGFISADELSTGLTKILKFMGLSEDLLTQDSIDDLIDKIDLDNDGEIDYNEFFKAFAYGTIKVEDRGVSEF